jgi:hypothetical protein
MPKKATNTDPRSRSSNDTELGSFATQLNALAGEFDDHAQRLRSSDAALVPIAAMRDAASRAGRLIVDLVRHRSLAATLPLPPWLAWRIEPSSRPEFSGWHGAPRYHAWNASRSLTRLLQTLAAERQVFDRDQVGQPSEVEPDVLHDRLIFLEAVAGWLGHRCTPRQQVRLPVGRVIHGTNPTGLRRDEQSMLVTIDWEGRTLDQSKLLFLDLGPACAAVCRYVASVILLPMATQPATATRRVKAAIADWQRHVQVVPAEAKKPARLILNLSALTPWPADGVGTQPLSFETDPAPSAATLMRVEGDPAVHEFSRISHELAAACGSIAAEFDRHEVDPTPAVQLQRALEKAPQLPTAAQAELVEQVQTQIAVLDVRLGRREGKSIFEIRTAWLASKESWAKFIHNRSSRDRGLELLLAQAPTAENPSTGEIFGLTPEPDSPKWQAIVGHVGFGAFARASHELARQTGEVINVLWRFGQPVDAAQQLARSLSRPEPIPTLRDYHYASAVEGQLRSVDSLVWRSVLSSAEDAVERKAFWTSEGERLQTREARQVLQDAVAEIMRRPRDLAHENAVLNLSSSLHQEESITVPLTEILDRPTPDAASKCQKWSTLADLGLRFFSHRSDRQPGVELVDFGKTVSANILFPSSACDTPQLRWAREMVAATQALRPLAADCGMSVDTQVAFASLERDLERILAGDAVDIRSNMEKVRVLAKTIATAPAPQEPREQLAKQSQARPAEGRPAAPARTLSGWSEILKELGLTPGDRRHREWLIRVNSTPPGPIRIISGVATVSAMELDRWWSAVVEQAGRPGQGAEDNDRREAAAEFEDSGARIEQGIHNRSGPNRKRRGRKS